MYVYLYFYCVLFIQNKLIITKDRILTWKASEASENEEVDFGLGREAVAGLVNLAADLSTATLLLEPILPTSGDG